MAKVANFNVAATQNFLTDTVNLVDKVRVRTAGGLLQVRPTNRTELKNLPKDEALLRFGVRREGERVKGGNVTVTALEELNVGDAFMVQKAKYGWYALTPVTGEIPAGAAVVKIAKK